MNPDYPPRPSRDWSWERGTRHWESRDPLALPPISWGSPRLVRGLVQDRLHQQNSTWTNRSTGLNSSFYSLTDLENSAELEPSVSLLGHLESGIVPVHVPADPESREHRPRPTASPRPVVRQGSTSRPSRTTRRSDWWHPPQVPLYSSVYDRPQYTSTIWSTSRTPVSGSTGLSVITRAPPATEVPAVGHVGDGARGASSLPGLGVPGQEDTDQPLDTREAPSARSPGSDCLHSIGLPKCPPSTRTRLTCQPRLETVWKEEDLVWTRPSGDTLVFRLNQGIWR